MTLRAVIIDDEQKGISTLKALITEYVTSIKVVADTTNAGKGIRLIEDYQPEIVFLDINMPEMSGFELLDKLRWKDFNLVFITAHQEFALKALKNNAVDYILKPVDHEELLEAVGRIAERRLQQKGSPVASYLRLFDELNYAGKNKLLISSKEGIEAIELYDVVYLESDSNYSKLYLTSGRVIVTPKTLKDFEDSLCGEGAGFMRVHHSYIVNLSKITRYMKSEEFMVLEDSHRIPLSKSKRESFYSWLKI